MEFSLSTYCQFQEEISGTLETLAKYTGYVELMHEAKHSVADAKLLRDYPLTYTIHTPFIGMNISSQDEKQRKHAIISIKKSINLAAEVDAELVVVHPGSYNEEKERNTAIKLMNNSLMIIKNHARDCGIPLVLENMGNWTDWGINLLQNPTEIPEDLGFCLDIGHSNLCGNISEFLKKPISHIHIHDNNGKTDEHASIGTGTIDINSVMEAIRINKIKHPVIECATINQALSSMELLLELS